MAEQGWICPKCGSVYSPSWYQCMKCAPENVNAPPRVPPGTTGSDIGVSRPVRREDIW